MSLADDRNEKDDSGPSSNSSSDSQGGQGGFGGSADFSGVDTSKLNGGFDTSPDISGGFNSMEDRGLEGGHDFSRSPDNSSSKTTGLIQSVMDLFSGVSSSVEKKVDSYLSDTKRTLGLSDEYDFEKELSEKAKNKTLSPREFEIRAGMLKGRAAGIANQSLGALAPKPASIGVNAATSAIGETLPASQDYGYQRGLKATNSGLVGDVAGVVGGMFGGPPGAAVAKGAAAALASNSIESPKQSTSNISNTGQNEGGNALQIARNAFTQPSSANHSSNNNPQFSNVNLANYTSGLLG